MHKKYFIIIALLFAPPLAALADYIVTRDTPVWFSDSFYIFTDDVATATAENKRVMIYFGQDGCNACARLHREVFNEPTMQAKLKKHFNTVAINIHGGIDIQWVDGKNYTEKSLAKMLGTTFTPSLVFLDEQGNIALKISGYRSREHINIATNYVIDKREESFSDYLKAVN